MAATPALATLGAKESAHQTALAKLKAKNSDLRSRLVETAQNVRIVSAGSAAVGVAVGGYAQTKLRKHLTNPTAQQWGGFAAGLLLAAVGTFAVDGVAGDALTGLGLGVAVGSAGTEYVLRG